MNNLAFTLVVSVYNEEEMLEKFWLVTEEELKKLEVPYEIIFVNDGSVDRSAEILNVMAEMYKEVKVIHFSTNFGHEAAMIAGIDHARGDAIICMDADLQHPPHCVKEMLEKFNEGYDVINMVRTDRKDGGLIKRITSKLFYKILNSLSNVDFEHNASDFFLISRKVAKVLSNDFRERTRFIRGFIQIIGFKKTILEYVAPKRESGYSKYSLFKLLRFSIGIIAIFSKIPLQLAIYVGGFTGILSFIVGVYSIVMKFLGNPVSGYTTIVVMISFLFSVQFLLMGIVGEYLSFLFIEQKKRPIYIIDEHAKIGEENKNVKEEIMF